MFRVYENPRNLEEALKKKQEEYDNLRLAACIAPPSDFVQDKLLDLHNEIEELKQRVNFAWQDEEYSEACAAEEVRIGEGVMQYV